MAGQSNSGTSSKPAAGSVAQLRTLAHDLSNSLETIMQATYLLAQGEMDDGAKRWVGLIDNASRDAARINREMRELLRALS